MERIQWLFLLYKMAREPSHNRVYIWRKLKKLGVVYLADSLCVLPFTERNLEHLQWIAAEIGELTGEASLWSSEALKVNQDEMIRKRFDAQVSELYAPILASLRQLDESWLASEEQDVEDATMASLKELGQQAQRVQSVDFFNSPAGQEVQSWIQKLSASGHSVAFKEDE